jgi:hypothetical protein
VAITPILIADQGPSPTPASYTVPSSQEINPTSVFAEFDGTGAAGPFIPVLRFVAQSGEILSQTFPTGVTLTTGDVARVTFAPFGFSASQGSTGGGLQFDTDPQPGDWFVASTTDVTPAKFPDPVTGHQYGWVFQADPATSGRGTLITASGDGSPQLHALDVDVELTGGIAKGVVVSANPTGTPTLIVAGDTDIETSPADSTIGWRALIGADGAGTAAGLVGFAEAVDGTATGAALESITTGDGASYGAQSTATSGGTGEAVGVDAIVSGSNSASGDQIALRGHVATGGTLPEAYGLRLRLDQSGAVTHLHPMDINVNGTVIFRIDPNGDVHIPTGRSYLADL